jgi:oligoribonuclease (3'-5' exoribonuclease)
MSSIPQKYLALDCEMSGLEHGSALLTVFLAVCDVNWNILDTLDLKVKPNDGQYLVQPEAMQVNRIDLIAHDKEAITYSEAGGILRKFLIKNSSNGADKLMPMGKGVEGDVKKITDCLLKAGTFNHYVTYRCYDITSIVIFLKKLGRLPEDFPDNLQLMCSFFGISQEWHTAKGDTMAGIGLIQHLESRLK